MSKKAAEKQAVGNQQIKSKVTGANPMDLPLFFIPFVIFLLNTPELPSQPAVLHHGSYARRYAVLRHRE